MSRPFFLPILAIPLTQCNDLVLVISTVTGINRQISEVKVRRGGSWDNFRRVQRLHERRLSSPSSSAWRRQHGRVRVAHKHIPSAFHVGLVKGCTSTWYARMPLTDDAWSSNLVEKNNAQARDLGDIRGVSVGNRARLFDLKTSVR